MTAVSEQPPAPLAVTGRVGSGIVDLDRLLGGLIPGDNVVWVFDDDDLMVQLEDALLREARCRGERCFYVTAKSDPTGLVARLGAHVTVLDARPRGSHANSAVLETAIIEGARGTAPSCVVFEGLGELARRWGPAKAIGFFRRVCPRLFDLGALAYWRAPRKELGRSFLEKVINVTQCVLEGADGHIRVVKAEGRPASVQGRLLRWAVTDGVLHLENERALARLARGLERLRRERNLSQSDLGHLAGVTPSAISQTEAGRRGLSLNTLLVLSDRLGVGLDDLLSTDHDNGYVLARHSRVPGAPNTAPLDDPHAELRAHLFELGPGERGGPAVPHEGPELVLVASGLVQLSIGSNTPVMRAGDIVLATRAAVSGWRNLMTTPALVLRVIRE